MHIMNIAKRHSGLRFTVVAPDGHTEVKALLEPPAGVPLPRLEVGERVLIERISQASRPGTSAADVSHIIRGGVLHGPLYHYPRFSDTAFVPGPGTKVIRDRDGQWCLGPPSDNDHKPGELWLSDDSDYGWAAFVSARLRDGSSEIWIRN